MTKDDFTAWQARHGLSLADAAKVLGVNISTIKRYKNGSMAIPQRVVNACQDQDNMKRLKRVIQAINETKHD